MIPLSSVSPDNKDYLKFKENVLLKGANDLMSLGLSDEETENLLQSLYFLSDNLISNALDNNIV